MCHLVVAHYYRFFIMFWGCDEMKVVIVGASFAGVHCALKIKELYPLSDVWLIEKKEKIAYIPSGLSMVLNQEIDSIDKAYFMEKSDLKKKGIHVLTNTEVHTYNLLKKELVTQSEIIPFDKLILATGSSQKSAKMTDREDLILTYKEEKTAQHILRQLKDTEEVIIIGAGQAGMELASGLVLQGKKVQLIETMNYPLYKYFDQKFLKSFYNNLDEQNGLTCHFNETVKEITQDTLVLSSGKKMDITHALVLSANSVRPDLSMFENQLQVNSDCTVYVDEYLETSIKDVFAIGDLIQVPSFLLNTHIYAPLISQAIQTGIVCAKNIFDKKEKMVPIIRTIGIKLFDYYLASTGLTESESFMYDGQVRTKTLEVSLSATQSKKITMKFVYDKHSFILLGVQLLSTEAILDKIDTFALMIQQKLDVRMLYRVPHFYNGLFSTTSLDSINWYEEGVDDE